MVFWFTRILILIVAKCSTNHKHSAHVATSQSAPTPNYYDDDDDYDDDGGKCGGDGDFDNDSEDDEGKKKDQPPVLIA